MPIAPLSSVFLPATIGFFAGTPLLELPGVSQGFPVAFVAVYVVGFIAAVSIGSIAWYNSKRPAGWEGQERPDFVPDVKPTSDKADGTKSD